MKKTCINKFFPIINNNKLLKYDDEGLWSITLPDDADLISNIIINEIGVNNNIIDCNSGIGGNSISFAKYFKKVISIELDYNRYKILENNINLFNLTNVNIINDDCIHYLNTIYDCYFFDPPWGGYGYKKIEKLSIKLSNLSLKDIINKIRINTNHKIIFKLPNNYNLTEFSSYDYKIYYIKNYLLIIIY